ncbi:MAG: class I SAM-dependent methyltransferase [Thermoleophilaceae bacterium]
MSAAANAGRDWDAATYERISAPQLAWGREVLGRLRLRGHESVLDAGCGGGRVTLLLRERLPHGRVVAADAAPSMVEAARATLGDDVPVLLVDLLELELEERVDAVFSNAVFHWVQDHPRLFARLYDALRPGGRLAAQCGGTGNVEAVGRAIRAVRERPPFATQPAPPGETWNFAGAEETAARLEAAGFEAVSTWLEPRRVEPPEPREFIRAVTLGPHLALLDPDLREPFVDAVTAELGDPLTLDYVRLNIDARRAG